MSNQHSTNGFVGQPHPSPAESLSSSFGGSSEGDSGYAGSPHFINPSDLSMGQDFDLYPQSSPSVHFTEDTKTEDSSSQEQPAKKEVKKRKSWGQQLPAPKTNLPPRKRAKTDDEKEQRRIERVLRNRRAAQSSRERKREEAEKLQQEKNNVAERCERLENALRAERARSNALAKQLADLGVAVKPVEELFIDSSPYQRAVDARQHQQESSPVPDEIQTPQQTVHSLPHIEDNLEQLPPSHMSNHYNGNFDTHFGFHHDVQQQKTIDPARLSPQLSRQNSPSIKPSTDSDPTLYDMSLPAAESDLPCQSLRVELKRNPSLVSRLAGSMRPSAKILSAGWSCIRMA